MERKTTRRVPLSMSVPRVGHELADKFAEEGAYAIVSRPTALKTVSYSDGAMLSEFTIKSETTVGVMKRSQLCAASQIFRPRFTTHHRPCSRPSMSSLECTVGKGARGPVGAGVPFVR